MSHFLVMVFSDEDRDVDTLLSPYDEYLVVPHYISKSEIIRQGREELRNYCNGSIYQEYLKDPDGYRQRNAKYPSHIKYLDDIPRRLLQSDEEVYQRRIANYSSEKICEDGSVFSIANPVGKYDWYEIGGRWECKLKTKSGDMVSSALIRDIDIGEFPIPYAVVLPTYRWCDRDETNDWKDTFIERFIDTASPEWTLTLVDCHV